MSHLKNFIPEVALFVRNPESGQRARFSGDIVDICLAVRECKSIYAAAERAGMPYTRAWRTIKEVEASLGFALFDRSGCQGSDLTDEGNQLLDAYLDIVDQLNEEARRLYKEAFDD